MTRYILWALRSVAIAVFVAFAAIILVGLDPFVWRVTGPAGIFTSLLDFAVGLRNVLTLMVFLFVEVAAFLSAAIGSSIYHVPPESLYQFYRESIVAYFQAFGFTLSTVVPPEQLIFYIFNFLQSLYFLSFWLLLFVAIAAGIMSFLRISGRLATLCFVTMMGLAILGAAGIALNIPGGENGYFMPLISTNLPDLNFLFFLQSPVFLVALMSFIYLEVSFQVVYFYSLLEPPTLREEQLRRQLNQLQTDAQRQVPIQTQDIPVPKALQRMLGSDAFRLMRQVIERKLLRREWLVELKDAHEVRRLNTFVNRLFREDPEAESTLTARASMPSLTRMTALSIGSSVVRFVFVILIAYICIHPAIFLAFMNAPPIIIESVELLFLPEKTLLFLLPLVLLFPLAATIIGYIRQRRAQPAEPIRPTLTQ
ncbi:MAG: hypothetical protein ACFFBR_02285 [Promethearchaeota archaeon]